MTRVVDILNDIPEYSDDMFLTILRDGGTEYDGTTADIGGIEEDILESKVIKYEILHNNDKVTYLIEIEGEEEEDTDMEGTDRLTYETENLNSNTEYEKLIKEVYSLKKENEDLKKYVFMLLDMLNKDCGKDWLD